MALPQKSAAPPWYENATELLRRSRECRASDQQAIPVSGYTNLTRFRRGGQGVVYLATRQRDGRAVALKIFHEQVFADRRTTQRFEREIQLVARLRHPCIVQLYGWGRTTDNRAYLSMEFVAGSSLAEALEGKSLDETLELFEDVCEAVRYAHRRGVLHRDLKPGNLRVDHGGRARLLDFGLARPLDAEASEPSVSITGDFMGTVAWASPEQFDGDVDLIDTRSDLYSLGLLLYWALSGALPYSTNVPLAALLLQRRERAPKPLRKQAPHLSQDVETVVMRCLAEDPNRRYADVGELLAELGHLRRGEPIAARRDSLGVMLGALVRRHRTLSWVVGVASVLLIAATATATWGWREARRGERRAEQAVAAKRAETDKVAAVNEFLLGSLLNPLGNDDPSERRLATAVDEAALRVESDAWLVDRPQVRADLHQAFAYWFAALPERHERAEEHIDKAWDLESEIDTPDAQRLATLLEMRSVLATKRGDVPQAAALLVRALDYAEPASLQSARLKMFLSKARLSLGEDAAAIDLLMECIDLFERHLGADHPQSIAARNGLESVSSRSP